MVLPSHRDLFVGDVANVLQEQGQFGESINYYSFLFYNKKDIQCIVFDNEVDCVKKILKLIKTGYVVSNYALIKDRIFNNDAKETNDLKNCAITKAFNLYENKIKELIVQKDSGNQINNEEYITDFFYNKKIDDDNFIAMFMGSCYAYRLISKEFFLDKTKNIFVDENINCMAGFAYLQDGNIKYYSNAYIPSVVNKWFDYQDKGKRVSCIYSKNIMDSSLSLLEKKEKFNNMLKETVDIIYFELLDKLKN